MQPREVGPIEDLALPLARSALGSVPNLIPSAATNNTTPPWTTQTHDDSNQELPLVGGLQSHAAGFNIRGFNF